MRWTTRPLLTALVASLFVVVGNLQSPPPANDARYRHAAPERPRARVALPPDAASGRHVHVRAGESLQAALDAAQPGDRITLEAGATYEGPFRLPRKTGNAWIVIASAAEAKLPRRGRRVAPADAVHMPRLAATGDLVIQAMPGAHHYRFVGVEIAPARGAVVNTLVQLGDRETSVDAQPHHIVIERSYLHGDPAKGARRGVAVNSRHTAIVDSYLADFKEVGADSQAISGWNGAGPFRIENNFLEAAGENVMFGGADPSVAQLVPADIEVVRNHLSKPLRWKVDHPSYEGTEWSVKNLFELKNARRVRIEGNVLERNWAHAQNGFAVLFTVRNQDGGAPWSVVEDVTFVNNLVRHVGGGINILGRDDNHRSQPTARIAIHNNLFLDVGGAWGHGRLFQLLDGTSSVSITHNTGLQTSTLIFGGDHAPHTAFVFQHNVALHNEYGIIGSSTEPGTQTLARYFPRADVTGNVIIGGNAGLYPEQNDFPDSLERAGAGLAHLRRGDLRSAASQTSDGDGPGVNVEELLKAVGGVAPLDGTSEPHVGRAGAAAVDPRAQRAAAVALWVCVGLLAYVYLGYPLLAVARARLRSWATGVRRRARGARHAHVEEGGGRVHGADPRVSVLVVAYNEEAHIGARLENLLALDYPADRLEIIVGSDGSTDETAPLALRYETLGVTVHDFETRRGKPAVLNDLVAAASGEIIVFADARQRFEASALRALVRTFEQPAVGAVSGELMLEAPAGAVAGEGAALYWHYEKLIRAAESRIDSTVGATGAIYAVRRSLFVPIPNDTVLDDVLIPLRVVQQGYRVLFEPAARAYDRASATSRQEFSRKARTIAGTFQLFARERWLFDPFRNRLWFATMSHKALRLTLPVLHGVAFAANLALASAPPYQWLLGAQLAFYAAAAGGGLQRQTRVRVPLVSVPYTLCLLCWADVVGFYRFVTGRQSVTWERLPSGATSDSPVDTRMAA